MAVVVVVVVAVVVVVVAREKKMDLIMWFEDRCSHTSWPLP